MTRDRISAHLYLPRNVLESDADRARHGEPRNAAEELHRALDAYAATLQGDRADHLISPEPEPIAAVRARQREAAEQAELQKTAEAAAAVILEQVTDPRRPHGLLGDEQLQARISSAATQTTALAKVVEVERRSERQQAEKVTAVRAQVPAELTGERYRLATALTALDSAAHRHDAAQDRLGAAQRKVTGLEATLRERYGGRIRGWLPSGERSRLTEQLRQAKEKLTGAARRDPAAAAMAATRREQAQQQADAQRRSPGHKRPYRPPSPGITPQGARRGYSR
ncbi:hypothetical protein [Streptosporangium canum]|uniref:hypothetical protein n=1 Tax=Streptosporangium canum TaxID=324952 RepID=UPI0037A87E83